MIFSLLSCFSVAGSLSAVSYISRESWVFVCIITVQSMMCANKRIHYGLGVVFDYLTQHDYIVIISY